MARTADVTAYIPARHNAALYPPERREACRVLTFMEHPADEEEFAWEYPADEHGLISMNARPAARRYQFTAAGRTLTVRQCADALTITLDGSPLDTASLDQTLTTRRGHAIAILIDTALRRETTKLPD
ncbi:hypothetical protein [Streptomyces sp. NPDC059631]|uniref:hypothetical protein n=1 Tax=unclassified Streptomyces TaxID=2593676 RepID=UPI0036C72D07